MNKKELIIEYLKGYELIVNTIDPLPREVFDFKPAPDKWSIREIIIHLVDSEVNSYIRFRTAIAENGKQVSVYDQNKWADTLLYEIQSIDDNLELFKFLRKNTYKLFINLPDKNWENNFLHPERGNLTLLEYLEEMTEHVSQHLNQIIRNYEQWEVLPGNEK